MCASQIRLAPRNIIAVRPARSAAPRATGPRGRSGDAEAPPPRARSARSKCRAPAPRLSGRKATCPRNTLSPSPAPAVSGGLRPTSKRLPGCRLGEASPAVAPPHTHLRGRAPLGTAASMRQPPRAQPAAPTSRPVVCFERRHGQHFGRAEGREQPPDRPAPPRPHRKQTNSYILSPPSTSGAAPRRAAARK